MYMDITNLKNFLALYVAVSSVRTQHTVPTTHTIHYLCVFFANPLLGKEKSNISIQYVEGL